MSRSTISQFLQSRPSGFYFRRKIPKKFHDVLLQREIIFSLRTSDKNTALFRAAHCLAITECFLAHQAASNSPPRLADLKKQLKAACTSASPSSSALAGFPSKPDTHPEGQLRSSPGLSLLLTALADVCMPTPPKIDPKFKKYLAEHLESLAQDNLSGFDDRLYSEPKLIAAIPLYEWFADQIRPFLSDPISFDPDMVLAPRIQKSVDAGWEKVKDHIGQSDPKLARQYFFRELLKALLMISENFVRIARDPTFIYSTSPTAAAPSEASTPGNSSPLMSEAWLEYAADVGINWSKSTRDMYHSYITEFCDAEFIGDKPISHLDRDDLIAYRNILHGLPSNRKKLKDYRGKSVKELLHMKIPDSDLMADRTINERLIHIGGLLSWCKSVKGYTTKDLTYGIQIKNPKSAERAAFTPGEIRALFSPEFYKPELINSPYKFWVPLIGLFSGARLSEICQLTTDDVFKEDGTWTLRVTDEGEGQKTKTTAGKRLIPVHKALIELGLIDYLQSIKKAGIKRLFPDLRVADKAGDAASKWFTRFRRLRGVDDIDALGKQKVFHSFRHTFITALMHGDDPLKSHFPIPLIQQIVGHEKSVIGETATYTKTYPITHCQNAVDSLVFDIDTPALKKCWLDVPKAGI